MPERSQQRTVPNAESSAVPTTGDPESAAIDAGYHEVVKQLYLTYWGKWMSAMNDGEKAAAALILRSGLNAARSAREQALGMLKR